MSQKIQATHLKVNYGAKSLSSGPFYEISVLLYDGKTEGP